MKSRWLRWIPVAATVILLAPIHMPALLAFPYRTEAHGFTVRSETPLPPALIDPILADAQARIATSPIAERPEQHSIYLTRGGWRWNWLALGSLETFAVTRMFTENTIVNRSDLGSNTVWSRRTIGDRRRLSSDIAHEVAHSMLRRELGIIGSLRAPSWAIEGYCDTVAGESTLSPSDAARLTANGLSHPVLANFNARVKVTQILASNGQSIKRLFADAR